eukprot:1747725-Rhodomonas_salina.1
MRQNRVDGLHAADRHVRDVNWSHCRFQKGIWIVGRLMIMPGCGLIEEREAQEGEIKPAEQTVSTTTCRSQVPTSNLPTARRPSLPSFLSPPTPFLASVPGEEHPVTRRG